MFMVAEGPMPKPPEPIVIAQSTAQEEEPVPLDEDGLPPPVLRSPDERSNEPVGQNKPTSGFVLLLLFLAFALVFGTMFYPLYSWMILDGDEFNWPAAIVLGGLVLAVFSSAVKYGKMNTFDRHTSRRNPLRRQLRNQRTETDLVETPWTGLLGPNYETDEGDTTLVNGSIGTAVPKRAETSRKPLLRGDIGFTLLFLSFIFGPLVFAQYTAYFMEGTGMFFMGSELMCISPVCCITAVLIPTIILSSMEGGNPAITVHKE